MSRLLSLIVLVVAVLYLAALFWTGSEFYSYATAPEKISLAEFASDQVVVEDPVELEISGQGFGPDTRVFMHMDVNNQSAVVGTLPFNDIIFDMELVGDRLYLASNSKGLLTLDVSNPLRPAFLSQLFQSRSAVLDIERKDNLLYLSSGAQGLKIAEIDERGILRYRRQLPTWSAAIDSKIIGSYLYVATGKAGLFCYDLNDQKTKKPFHVVEVSSAVRGIESYGQYLYIAAGSGGLKIYRQDDSGIPELLDTIDEPFVRSVEVVDDSLYVLASASIKQFSLAKPFSPKFVAGQSHFSTPQKLHFSKDTIYVSDNESGLGIIDSPEKLISAPVDVLSVEGDPRAVQAIGKWLYVAVSRAGIKIIDSEAILSKHVVKTITTPGVVRDIQKHAGQMFILDSKAGLVVRESQSERERRIQTGVAPRRIGFSDDRIMITGAMKGLEFYQAGSLDKVDLLETWPEVVASDLVDYGDYFVIGSNTRGLSLYRKKGQPRLIHQLPDVSTAKVLKHNNLIITAGGTEGVKIFTVNSDRLTLLGEFNLSFPIREFAGAIGILAKKKHLFIANGDGGLVIVDISDPSAPELVSTLWLPGYALRMLYEDNRLYVVSRYSGLHTIDISDLSQPRLVDTTPIYDLSGAMAVDRGELYLANRYMGVIIIPPPVEIEDVTVLSGEKLKIRLTNPPAAGRYSFYVSNKKSGAGYEGAVLFK